MEYPKIISNDFSLKLKWFENNIFIGICFDTALYDNIM
jgi:hypothetical protein